jgi:hypothetical protein
MLRSRSEFLRLRIMQRSIPGPRLLREAIKAKERAAKRVGGVYSHALAARELAQIGGKKVPPSKLFGWMNGLYRPRHPWPVIIQAWAGLDAKGKPRVPADMWLPPSERGWR